MLGSRYKSVQNMQSTLQRSGSALYRQRFLSLSLYGTRGTLYAGVCLCLFLALDVVYLPIYAKLGLVVDMTNQMSDGRHSELLTLDFPRINNSLCLPPYHLTCIMSDLIIT